MKHRLTSDQEFQLLKIVLDKFLWIGLGIMLFGFWLLAKSNIQDGVSWIVAGAVILLLFVILIIKHYEVTP